jgi:hypothetical protein
LVLWWRCYESDRWFWPLCVVRMTSRYSVNMVIVLCKWFAVIMTWRWRLRADTQRNWDINNGSMQITFYRLSFDFYPFHPAGKFVCVCVFFFLFQHLLYSWLFDGHFFFFKNCCYIFVKHVAWYIRYFASLIFFCVYFFSTRTPLYPSPIPLPLSSQQLANPHIFIDLDYLDFSVPIISYVKIYYFCLISSLRKGL